MDLSLYSDHVPEFVQPSLREKVLVAERANL